MKLILLLLVLALLNIPTINSQNQTKMKQTALVIPEITPDFEKLDTLEYQKIKWKDETFGSKYLPNGTRIYVDKDDDIYIYIYTLPNSFFTVVKNYYLNGNIKYKGLVFNHNDFLKGKWYEYDENGKITEQGDYDTPYKYGFEKILAFCQKEGIELKTGDIDKRSLYSPTIHRRINPDTQRPEWVITNFIEADYGIRYIWIDGITGDPIHDYIMPIAQH